MDDKFTRAHNRMAMATGETKTRTKLSKSKHGWIKIAMGVTFASTSLFLMSSPTFADENSTTTVNQNPVAAQSGAQTTGQNQENQQPAPANSDLAATPAQTPSSQNDTTTSATTPVDNQASQPTDGTADVQATQPTQLAAQPTQLAAQSGTYTAHQTQAIRDGASLSANVVNTLNPGESVNYDSTSENDGYQWLHYTSYSGQAHYVAKLNDDAPTAVNNTTSNISPDHQSFINQVAPGAQSTWDKYGVLPSVSIAQAIVESAWGQSAPGNNLYGIKGDYNGNSTLQTTQEYYNGQYVTIQDQFRAYPDLATSVEDHGKFLAVNPRYANLLYSQDYNYVCQMLQADGYATDPQYANTLISIISYNNLHQFDKSVGQSTTPSADKQTGTSNQAVPANPSSTDTGAKSNTDHNLSNQPTTNTTNGSAANSQTSSLVDNQTASPNDNSQMTPASGSYTVTQTQPVRTGASTSAEVAATLDPGDIIYYDGTTNNDGYNWMHYISYSGASHWVADLNQNPATPTAPSNGDTDMTPASGAYTTSGAQNVRDAAGLSSNVSLVLNPGETIYYDGTKQADGYTWLHYTSYSGHSRWLANLNQEQPTPTAPNNNDNDTAMTPATGSYTPNQSQSIRNGASTSASVAATLNPGNTIYYDGTTNNDGYTWYHYISYSGASHWVADLNQASSTPAPTTPNNGDTDMTPASGAYTTSGVQNVRDAAGLSSNVSVVLNPGETIYYDGTKQADGYTWLHYTSYSGQSRWIAKLNLAF